MFYVITVIKSFKMKQLSLYGVFFSLLYYSSKAANVPLQNGRITQQLVNSSPYSILVGKMITTNTFTPVIAYQKQYQINNKETTVAKISDESIMKINNKTILLVQNRSSTETNSDNFSNLSVLEQLNRLKLIGINVFNSLYNFNDEFIKKNQQLIEQQNSKLCCINGNCTMQNIFVKCNNTLIDKTFQKNLITPKEKNEFDDLTLSPTEISTTVVKLYSRENENSDNLNQNKSILKTEVPTVDLPDDEVEGIRKEILLATNNYRESHQCDDLLIDKEINDYAQQWSNYLTTSYTFQHREQPRKYGENLFKVFSNYSINIGLEAVKSWYNEILIDEGYKFNGDEKEMSKQSSLHFTQLIWRSSKKMGVGVSKSKDGWYNIVVNYWPPGNIINMFKENVFPRVENK
ncbi:uncharacterized protein LOC126902530 isoform X2 [Daktulosphaira vitifoliae]|uniref:uncharacterized protein LOC126902530 isoform X2 n=1 Tax=Daktulosphaira vitifoliae TaxID=58002 RepID=UPI0021AA4C5C|nr:uncharacterized protein LOC126902530 isoform X2 [Daktulosphaira vitifoliae]